MNAGEIKPLTIILNDDAGNPVDLTTYGVILYAKAPAGNEISITMTGNSTGATGSSGLAGVGLIPTKGNWKIQLVATKGSPITSKIVSDEKMLIVGEALG